MPKLTLNIALSAERLLALYRGDANRVQLISREGKRVVFPAMHLRAFMTREGVYGVFELEFSPEGKFVQLRRLE